MTTFQLTAAAVFAGVVLFAYRKELLSLNPFRGILVPRPAPTKSVALTIVSDLVSVTELRDKLAAEDCPQGVEACTNLLRVIVEHQTPAKVG